VKRPIGTLDIHDPTLDEVGTGLAPGAARAHPVSNADLKFLSRELGPDLEILGLVGQGRFPGACFIDLDALQPPVIPIHPFSDSVANGPADRS
jgi:hypothetical protein